MQAGQPYCKLSNNLDELVRPCLYFCIFLPLIKPIHVKHLDLIIIGTAVNVTATYGIGICCVWLCSKQLISVLIKNSKRKHASSCCDCNITNKQTYYVIKFTKSDRILCALNFFYHLYSVYHPRDYE